MGALFNTGEAGQVDLYYNDLHALRLVIAQFKEQPQLSKADFPFNDEAESLRRYDLKLKNTFELLKFKSQIHQGSLTLNPHNNNFLEQHHAEFLSFLQNLPQT